jgi:transcription termination/antitermination protein NusA
VFFLKIKYDNELMKIMAMFNSISDAQLKDCISAEGQLVFVVEQNDLGKAIGKHGSRVRMLENALNRKIKIVEFNPDVIEFVRNLVHPIHVQGIEESDGKLIITPADHVGRGLLIGRSAQNLRGFEAIVKRYFKIDEIRVV